MAEFAELTGQEQAAYEHLTGLVGSGTAALMRVRLAGRDVAAVVQVEPAPDGGGTIRPLAVLVDEALMTELDPGDLS